MTVNPDLQHLIHLQELDLAAERVRRRIEDIPGAVAALDDRLSERTAVVAAVKAKIDASQTARREIDKELAVVQGRLSKFKGQLMEVKTNKEYQAMQHEIAAAEQGVREHEDRLLDRMEEQETLAAELKASDAALKSEQAEVARERKSIEAERGELERKLEQQTSDRAALAAQISRCSSNSRNTARESRSPRRGPAAARSATSACVHKSSTRSAGTTR